MSTTMIDSAPTFSSFCKRGNVVLWNVVVVNSVYPELPYDKRETQLFLFCLYINKHITQMSHGRGGSAESSGLHTHLQWIG